MSGGKSLEKSERTDYKIKISTGDVKEGGTTQVLTYISGHCKNRRIFWKKTKIKMALTQHLRSRSYTLCFWYSEKYCQFYHTKNQVRGRCVGGHINIFIFDSFQKYGGLFTDSYGGFQDLKIKLYGEDGQTADLTLKNKLGLKEASSGEFVLENCKNVGILKEVGLKLVSLNSIIKTLDRRFSVDGQNQAYVTIVRVAKQKF